MFQNFVLSTIYGQGLCGDGTGSDATRFTNVTDFIVASPFTCQTVKYFAVGDFRPKCHFIRTWPCSDRRLVHR